MTTTTARRKPPTRADVSLAFVALVDALERLESLVCRCRELTPAEENAALAALDAAWQDVAHARPRIPESPRGVRLMSL